MIEDRPRTKFSLLIVEDDSVSRNVLAGMISRRYPGCTLYTAGNGIQGLELFKHFHPEIIMADINLPVLDGVEMIREMRSIQTGAAYIVVTAYTDKRNLARIRELDAGACLIKPLSFKAIFAALERCHADTIGENTRLDAERPRPGPS